MSRRYLVSLSLKHECPYRMTVLAEDEQQALRLALGEQETIDHFEGKFPSFQSVELEYNRHNLDVLLEQLL